MCGWDHENCLCGSGEQRDGYFASIVLENALQTIFNSSVDLVFIPDKRRKRLSFHDLSKVFRS